MCQHQIKKTTTLSSPISSLFAYLPVEVLWTIASYIPKGEHFVLALSCMDWRGILPGPYKTYVFATPAIHDMAGRPIPTDLAHLGGAPPSVASKFSYQLKRTDVWFDLLPCFYEAMAKANNVALFWWSVENGLHPGGETEWHLCAFRNKHTDIIDWLLQHASLDHDVDGNSDLMEGIVEIVLDDAEGADAAEKRLFSLCRQSRVYFLAAMIVAIQRANVPLLCRLWKAYELTPSDPFKNSYFFNIWRFRLEALYTKNEAIVRCLHDLRLFPSLEASDMLLRFDEQHPVRMLHVSRVIEFTHMKNVCEWVRQTF